MSNTEPPIVEARQPDRRRRFTPEQKQAQLNEAKLPGNSVSGVAPRHGAAPRSMFQSLRAMEDATQTILKANNRVVSCDVSLPKDDGQ